ncbi:MAG: hypothetical protein RML49_06080 [Verrucomicrobiae bacterium]|nr:hypothetical protein [Verrucomicrobiae bacterium]
MHSPRPLIAPLSLTILLLTPSPAPSQNNLTTIPRRTIIEKFSEKYIAADKPRIVIYINRNQIPPTPSSPESIVPNPNPEKNQSPNEPQIPPADARTIDECFAAPFFEAGVRFVDEDLAAPLQRAYDTADNFLHALTRSHNRPQTEFIRKNADIAIELLVHKKPTTQDPQKESPYQIKATAYDLTLPGSILARAHTDELATAAPAPSPKRPNSPKTPLQEQSDQLALLLMQRLIPTLQPPPTD